MFIIYLQFEQKFFYGATKFFIDFIIFRPFQSDESEKFRTTRSSKNEESFKMEFRFQYLKS